MDRKLKKCPDCDGFGCSKCNNTGEVDYEKTQSK